MRGRGAPLIVTLLALAMAGCTTVGPDFKPPAAPSATGYTSPGERTAPDPDAGPATQAQTLALGEKVTGRMQSLVVSVFAAVSQVGLPMAKSELEDVYALATAGPSPTL